MIYRPLNLACLSVVFFSANAKVSLNSSAVSACPGDTLVFTCTTDTGELVWSSGGVNELFYGSLGQGTMRMLGNFTLNLTSVTGMMQISTATIYNLSLEDDKKVINCSDSSLLGSDSAHKMVPLSDPLSPPLNMTFISCSTLSYVTISWVAQLDTPLCVHSYTVTVRNSSQVIVYNTTDNRSSLSITDLTSDSEYSVTVAGRDGAGRLGQESEKLNISTIAGNVQVLVKMNFTIDRDVVHTDKHQYYGLLIHWNQSDSEHYLITHNVSSDQSPITTNRTSVTLYGVQPGETYTVMIFIYPFKNCTRNTFYDTLHIPVDMLMNITVNSSKTSCTTFHGTIVDSSVMPIGFTVSIASSVLLGVVMLCYIVMCFCTSSLVQNTSETTNENGHSLLTCQQSKADDEVDCHNVNHTVTKEIDAVQFGAGADVSLPTYDYVRHQ